MALHSIGHLPYHFTTSRVGNVIGPFLHLSHHGLPLKQCERDANDQIYERAYDADECAGRGPVTACNGQYRRALDQKTRGKSASNNCPSAAAKVSVRKAGND